MSTLECNRSEFDQSAKEFFDALPEATEDSAENGFKALVLMYFGMEGSDRDEYEASMVIRIAGRKMIEKGFML